MPAIMAHYSFGEDVLEQLPKSIKEKINKHLNMFVLGLQGPDILYYTRPITGKKFHKMGSSIHKMSGGKFFESRLKLCTQTKSESLLVYIIGAVCHFWLDKNCHPFVCEKAPKMSEHHRLESELDSFVAQKKGITLKKYKLIPTSKIDCSALAQAYDITLPDAKCAVRDFRKFARILHHRKLVRVAEILARSGEMFSQVSPQKEFKYTQYTQELYKIMEHSVHSCVNILCDIFATEAPSALKEGLNYSFDGQRAE